MWDEGKEGGLWNEGAGEENMPDWAMGWGIWMGREVGRGGEAGGEEGEEREEGAEPGGGARSRILPFSSINEILV